MTLFSLTPLSRHRLPYSTKATQTRYLCPHMYTVAHTHTYTRISSVPLFLSPPFSLSSIIPCLFHWIATRARSALSLFPPSPHTCSTSACRLSPSLPPQVRFWPPPLPTPPLVASFMPEVPSPHLTLASSIPQHPTAKHGRPQGYDRVHEAHLALLPLPRLRRPPQVRRPARPPTRPGACLSRCRPTARLPPAGTTSRKSPWTRAASPRWPCGCASEKTRCPLPLLGSPPPSPANATALLPPPPGHTTMSTSAWGSRSLTAALLTSAGDA